MDRMLGSPAFAAESCLFKSSVSPRILSSSFSCSAVNFCASPAEASRFERLSLPDSNWASCCRSDSSLAAQCLLHLVLNHQRRRRPGDDQRAQTEFQLGCRHNFKVCQCSGSRRVANEAVVSVAASRFAGANWMAFLRK